MDSRAQKFLEDILQTPSPSGYESRLQSLVRQYVADFADKVESDVHGNLYVCRNPGANRRLMLAGHCDQIGLIVNHIDDQGFIYIQSIGGWDPIILVGQRMCIWTQNGPVHGVLGRKPIHLLTDEERKQVPKLKDLWIDIGAANKAEAEKMVRIGDPVTLELKIHPLANNRIASPALDDKCGTWVVMEALRRIDPAKLTWAVYAVSTVQEEVGLRGAKTSAYRIDPEVGIAVDVTHATDCPTVDKKEEGDIALGKGPVIYRGPNMNPRVVELLMKTAETHQIPHQLGASGRITPTDLNPIQVSRGGVATGLVSIPNRYMHSPVETISLDDLDRAADLLARFAESLTADMSFIP
ncbi:MAG: M42 family metallopeptidase [Thermoguttaceae bacterium]|nr:M42 family metallopeptidase [Thermoguttaceae bacterium]MDW8080158.1 M42 family metallopeptidase [Thermoguttaceae bacterium]